MKHRPDIDGLRAVAVLMVLLFHCGFSSFQGGYIGVDVFFVISGFLITSIILSDIQNDKFSFVDFYARRIRRLVPAMLVTVLLTLIVAFAVMTPQHLVDTSTSGALSVVSLANIYFAKFARYFDASSHLNPFLHMWSLSVEEQFYLFWPAVLVLLSRLKWKGAIFAFIFIGFLFGLVLSELWIAKNPNHAYFLLPFRAFQFLMGALCIWLLRVEIRSKMLAGAFWVCGLSLILLPAMTYSDATPFPGIAAAVPSLGTMLLIWQGQNVPMRRLLDNRVAVWFGQISYSTYLVHWPIVVFWTYLAINPLSFPEKIVLFVLSVAAGQLLHSLVAQRFRYPRPGQKARWRFPVAQTGLAALVGLIGLGSFATAGFPARFTLVPQTSEYREQSEFPFLRDYGDGIMRLGADRTGRVLIFGDSMAQNYVSAILQLDGFRDAEVDIVSRGGCVLAKDAVLMNYGSPDQACLDLRDRLYQMDGRYDLVIWSQSWLAYGKSLNWEVDGGKPVAAFAGTATFEGWRAGILKTLQHFDAQAKKLIVIGPPVMVENVNPIIGRIGPLTNISAIADQLGQMREAHEDARGAMGNQMREFLSAKTNASYIDPRSIFCDVKECHLSNGYLSYYLDELHNTSAATSLIRDGLECAGLRL